MGLRQTHKQEFKMKSTYTTKDKRRLMQIEWKWCDELSKDNLKHSFTCPTTFGRRHHSPPYNILCASLQGLHPNVTFPQDSQMGVPKLGLLLSQNFGCLYFFQIKFFLIMKRKYLIALKKISPTHLNRSSFNPCFQGVYGQESNSQFDSHPFF